MDIVLVVILLGLIGVIYTMMKKWNIYHTVVL